jgi:hypothetical protein
MAKAGRPKETNPVKRIQKQIRIRPELYAALKYELVPALHKKTGDPETSIFDAIELSITEAIEKYCK